MHLQCPVVRLERVRRCGYVVSSVLEKNRPCFTASHPVLGTSTTAEPTTQLASGVQVSDSTFDLLSSPMHNVW